MYEDRFSNWRSWGERDDYSDVSRPGVYVIALSNNTLSGRSFSWRKDVVYIGMSNAVAGLKGRLQQFDNTMRGKRGHGGADRLRFKHRGYQTFRTEAYVAVAPFDCEPASQRPRDLRVMGEVARFEYWCLAHFADRFGRLPEFNDKKMAPKYSRAVARSRRR